MVIKNYEDVPEVYFLELGTYRGSVTYKEERKPLNPADIPAQIYIKEVEKSGKKLSDFELVKVALSSLNTSANNAFVKQNTELIAKQEKLVGLEGVTLHYFNSQDLKPHFEKRFGEGAIDFSIPLQVEDRFLEYQKMRAERNDVVMNLELKDTDSPELFDFKHTAKKMQQNYGIVLTEEEKQKVESKLKVKIVNEIVDSLSARTDKHAIINADFILKISETSTQHYELSYSHPLSPKTEIKIYLAAEFLKKDMQMFYATMAAKNKKINLYVYGSILSADEEYDLDGNRYFSEIQIKPNAIYTL